MKIVLARLGVAPFLFVLGLLLGSALTGTAFAYTQTHMANALHDLQSAQRTEQTLPMASWLIFRNCFCEF